MVYGVLNFHRHTLNLLSQSNCTKLPKFLLQLDEDRRKDNAASQKALEAKFSSSVEPKKSAEEMEKTYDSSTTSEL